MNYIVRKMYGFEKIQDDDGFLWILIKIHQGQRVWGINFASKEQIPGDSEVELFFHETPEVI